ncbi:MAG: N-acetylmuramoyl-L-alanine amidase [Firmicutes bacterium]|nr:N-acetylmuramoyl-L-alanine amidase [Bacillota bacterium]
MDKNGKFILFTPEEFKKWLNENKFIRKIKLIQNHHTFMPSYAEFKKNNHFQLLKNMEEYHVKSRGFNEIAQNLTTFPDGKVAVCRSINTIPAGIKGANQFGICIEHLGNFDMDGDQMTEEHRHCIISINASLCKKFKLSPSADTIVYHHWWDLDTGKRTNGTGNVKSCPGTNFFGGNSVAAAQKNFIPLVKQAMG